MRRFLILTLILITVVVLLTTAYFKNLNQSGLHSGQVLHTIPSTAVLVFEFNNDKGFYEIFSGNKLLSSITGEENITNFITVKNELLNNPSLESYFKEQNVFISMHPQKENNLDFLFTITATNDLNPETFDRVSKNHAKGLVLTPAKFGGISGYNVFFSSIKKRFYLFSKGDNVYTGSFSKSLTEEAATYSGKSSDFVLLSDRQNSNSLANLYVNYQQLPTLFENLFKNKNTDIFKSFRLLPASSTLSLNYKTDALMLNGLTTIHKGKPASYLNLFSGQQPVVNHLQDIFPATTAYSMNFSVSDPAKFGSDLSQWHTKAGLNGEKKKILDKVKAETGIRIQSEFNALLANEFAVITTRFQEKIGIIQVKNGSALKPVLANISSMNNEETGRFNYEKLPFFLLGDAYSVFKKPYFRILDNYLILANSESELTSYYDSYINRKFLSKMNEYNDFSNLLSERSNVAFFINFKNAQSILKQELNPHAYSTFQTSVSSWKDFYGASLQFTATDANYYTNFCIRLSADTVTGKH